MEKTAVVNQIYQLHVDKVNEIFTPQECALKSLYHTILGVLVYGYMCRQKLRANYQK